MLPAICFGHPCELPSPNSLNSAQGIIASDASDMSDECPFTHGADYCETTCCCAGHVPSSAFMVIPHADLTARLLPYEPHLALPRLIDRIFVPPQNLT
jgi:hypothetical protein